MGRTPRRLQLTASSLSCALCAAPPQEPVRQDAALKEGIELVFDEPRQFTACAGLGVRDEADRMLLHQAVPVGLLGAVALVVERCANWVLVSIADA